MSATKTKEIIFHSVLLNQEFLKEQKVQVIYFPQETFLFLERFNNNFKWETQVSTFRLVMQGIYSEKVICANFSERAFRGEEPWLFLSEKSNGNTGSFIHSRFLNWLENTLQKKYPALLIPESLRFLELPTNNYLLSDAFDSKNMKMIFSSYLAYKFVQNEKNLKFQYLTNEGAKDFSFPEKWYSCFVGNDYEVISEPVHPKYNIGKKEVYQKQCFSYVISFVIEVKKETKEVLVNIQSSKRRWNYRPLKSKAGRYDFPRKDRRTIFFINDNTNSVMTIPINEHNNRVYFSYYNLNKEIFKTINIDHFQLEQILENPSVYYQSEPQKAFIPYKVDDKKGSNYLQSGLSKYEKHFIFEMFNSAFPSLSNAYSDISLVELKNATLRKNMIWIDDINHRMGEKLILELWSKNEKILEWISKTFHQWNSVDEKYKRFEIVQDSLFVYRLFDKENDHQLALSIEIKLCNDQLDLIADLEVDKNKYASEIKRIKKIRTELNKSDDIIYSLIEINKYENDELSDPKNAIHLGFNEVGRITQFFHPIDEKSYTQQKSIIRSSLNDLLARKGFMNQMIQVYRELFSKNVFYFPNLIKCKTFSGGTEYLYILVRMQDSKIEVKYPSTDWMTLEKSLIYLSNENKKKLLKKDNKDFTVFIEQEIQESSDVVVFYKDDLPEKYKNHSNTVFTLALYDISKDRNPFILNLQNGKPSTGTFLVRNGNEYFSVPPKLSTDTNPMTVTNHEMNTNFSHRHTFRLTLKEPNDEIAKSLHLMRNIAITFDSYINNPLPIHLIRHHKKLLI
jgi:hypothetical protein